MVHNLEIMNQEATWWNPPKPYSNKGVPNPRIGLLTNVLTVIISHGEFRGTESLHSVIA